MKACSSFSVSWRRLATTVLVAIPLVAPLLASAQTVLTHDLAGNRTAQTAAVAGPPTIAVQPANQLGQIGGAARFGVVAGGPGPFTYQWFADASPIAGATGDTLVLSNLTTANFTPNPAGTPKYSVRVTNASGNVTSTTVALYLDTNGGGMADWWQVQYFGALGVNPSADTDGDGVSNLQEYRDGTTPNAGSSRLGRLAVRGPSGLVAASPVRDTYAGGATSTAVAIPYGELQFGGWTGTYRSLSESFLFGFPAGGSFVGDVALIGLYGALPPQETVSSPAFTNANGSAAQVTGFAPAPDGSAIVFGTFDRVNGVARPFVARLLPSGSLDANFAPAPDDLVTSAVIQSDGKILLAGSFATIGGQARPGVARFLANGTLDSSFVPASQGTNRTQAAAVAVQRDGKVLYGGALWVGASSRFIARLNGDGSLDAAFNPALDGAPTALAMQPDARIMLGGSFSQVNGTSVPKLVRLDASGALDPTFAPDGDGGVRSAPLAVVVQPDGRILAGGSVVCFVQFLGVYALPVVRMNANGTRDEAFNTSVRTALPDRAFAGFALQGDGRIVGVGNFTVTSPSLANAVRLNADGSLDPAGFAVSRANAPVGAVAVASDGSVLFGGAFTQVSPGAPLQNQHAYFLTSSRSSWTAAEAQATSIGGHLVAINSAFEQDFLLKTFLPAAAPLRVSDGALQHPYWIGANNYDNPPAYGWSTGEPFTYTNWAPNEPDNYRGTEHVGVMNFRYLYDNQAPGVWTDIPDAGADPDFPPALVGGFYGVIEVDQNAPVIPGVNPSLDWIAGRDLLANEITANDATNPNAAVPAWSYGYRAAVASNALTLYASAQHSNSIIGNSNLQGWVDGGNFVAVNASAKEMLLYPRADGAFTVVRWTAPEAATYSVTAFWQDADFNGGDGASASLVINGATLYSFSFPNAGNAFTTQVATLAAGATVDFVLGAGADASADSTRFNAIIRKATAVQARTWVSGRDLTANELSNGGANQLTNPNATVPEWRYGRRSTPVASDLLLWSGAGDHNNAIGAANIQGWAIDNTGLGVNVASTSAYYAGLPFQPGEMLIFPSADGVVPVVRWTAPRAGAYDVLAFWQDGDNGGGDGYSAHIVVNGVQVFSRTLDNGGGCSAAQSLVLQTGDTVDFTMGIRGGFSYDVTKFNCAILDGDLTPAGPVVPPPPVYGDSFTRARPAFARMVPTNHLLPGTLGISPAGPVFATRPAATLTLPTQLSSVSVSPVSLATLESSSDGVNFVSVTTGTVDFSSGLSTFAVPALPPGTTYFRARVENSSRESARSYAVGPLTTPPAVTSALTAAGVIGQAFTYQGTATGPLTSFTAASLPAWATAIYDPNTGILSITGTATPGFSTVTLTPANIAGATPTPLSVLIANRFGNWQSTYFTPAELGNPAISGALGDATGTGIPNLLRYALGIPARRTGSTAGLPFVSTPFYTGTRYLTLTYTRDRTATDVALAVQVTGNLASGGVNSGWAGGTTLTTEVSRTDNGNGTETVVTRDNVPLTGNVHRFIRLMATAQ